MPETYPGKPVYLLACVSRKLSFPAPARDLYCSDWFRKAQAYAQEHGAWMVLSAKHGLIAHDEVIAPYEMTLNSMGASERRTWSDRVIASIKREVEDDRPLVILAGQRYREHLVAWAPDRISVPMKGLAIGQQLAWLYANTRIQL